MAYLGPDDPELCEDLAAALHRWRKPSLADCTLATRLVTVQRRLAAEPDLMPAAALRHIIRTALDRLRAAGQTAQADLLDQRYLHDEPVHKLAHSNNLSERSMYYWLEEATRALAQALWAVESGEPDPRARERPASDATSTPASAMPPPHAVLNLPAPTYTRLFGVDQTLAELVERLRDPRDGWLVSIEGMGGLGKTALAREAAGRLAATGRFAGIAWVTAKQEFYTWRGIERTEGAALTFELLLDSIAEQLNTGDSRPLYITEKREYVCRLLRSHPYLVVVDNLEAVQDCEKLPGQLWKMANPTKFLLTSRHQVAPYAMGQAAVSSLSLDHLAEGDALDLLRYEVRQRGVRAIAEAADQVLRPVLDAIGGHPLAIQLVAGQLAALSLHRVLATLDAPRTGEDAFYDYLYHPSWDLLSEAARRLLLLMAVLPASGATWEDLAGVAIFPEAELERAIIELASRSLLQAGGVQDKIYTIHPLTRRFVAGQPGQAEALQSSALQVGRYYRDYARQHTDDWGALARRQDHILQAIELCAPLGSAGQQIAVDCARLLGSSMGRRGCLAIWLPYLDIAVRAAGELGDEAAQADLWNQQGRLIGSEGDLEAVLALHQRAAAIFERLGDRLSLARTLRLMGNVYYTRADRTHALACYEQARDLLLALSVPESRELSRIYHNIACVHTQELEWPQAASHYEHAMALVDPVRDQPFCINLLNNVGQMHYQMGCWQQAVADLLRVLPLAQSAGDLVGQITAHHFLCLSYAGLDNCALARSHGRQGLALSARLGSPNTRAHLCTDLAAAYLEMGDIEAASGYLAIAEPLWSEIGATDGLSRIRQVQGDVNRVAGAWDKAEAAYQESLILLEDRKDHQPRRVKAWLGLAAARLAQGNSAGAEALLPAAQALATSLSHPDLRVRVLWLQADLYPAGRRQMLEAALALCRSSDAANDLVAKLRRQTQDRLDNDQ